MPLYQQGGLSKKGYTDLGGVPRAIMMGLQMRELMKRRKLEEARQTMAERGQSRQSLADILGMAGTDPSVLESPEFETLRQELGYPKITVPQSVGPGGFFEDIPRGYEGAATIGPYGQFKGGTIKTRQPKSKADLQSREMRKLIRRRREGTITPDETTRLDRMMTGATGASGIYPPEYKSDLAKAVNAIGRGADRFQVFQRIAAQYPGQSAELKRILIFTPDSQRLNVLREALGLGE